MQFSDLVGRMSVLVESREGREFESS